MGRPLGSKNKILDSVISEKIKDLSESMNKNMTIEKIFGKPEIHYDAIYAIRVLRNGQFRGLWELVRLDNDGNRVQVLTDANSRGMCSTILNRQLMRIVVRM